MIEIQWQTEQMENNKSGRTMDAIRAKAQDTRAKSNSWETHLVRKRWDIGLLRALSPRMMHVHVYVCITMMKHFLRKTSTSAGCFRFHKDLKYGRPIDLRL